MHDKYAGLPVYLASPAASNKDTRTRRRAFRATVLLCALGLLYHLVPPSPHIGVGGNPAFLIKARNGAVATENVLCSNLGVDILKAGGNAVDAAIAATFCIGTVNMFSSGIGGGGFMTVRIPPVHPGEASQGFTVDFRETAPGLANKTMYPSHTNMSRFGGLAVGVPGEVRGLAEAHRRWGSFPWKTLIEPSVALAKGWTVQRELAQRITWYPTLMLGNPDWSAVFAPNGTFLREGEVIMRSNYSRTLATIASEGPDAFYKGPIADAVVRKVRATGGILSHADLENYRVKVDHALQGTYRGRKVYTSHAPTSGPVLLHMLNLVSHFPMTTRTPLNVHRIVEVLKFGFAARTKICDPDFTNNTKRIDEISTKAFAALIAPNITDDRTHPPEYYNPEFDITTDHGTSHTSVVDKNGMAVSLTSTVNLIFGSQVLDPETGMILNDQMDDFSTPGTPNGFGLWPSPYNYPEPGKRPLSSTVPTIVEHGDGSLAAVLGGSGGSRIFGAVFQVLLNLDWGLDASAAVEYGRVHTQLLPQIVDADVGYPPALLAGLGARGHTLSGGWMLIMTCARSCLLLSVTPSVAAVVQVIVQHEDGQIFGALADSMIEHFQRIS
ncbi:gamma-glutamyltranspeptidase-domain-containing protein [Mycena galericulata]|nr:gamma-glutamyltranspeptidase-domain-containing protein [Mycena galericulata]